MKLLIVRHGDPDYVKDSLTEKGWREAELLSRRLAKEPISAAYLSPLGRAQDTASLTLQKLGIAGETLPWLPEFRARIVDPIRGEMRIPWDLMPLYWTEQPELYHKEDWRQNTLFGTGDVEAVWDEMATGLDGILARYGYIREHNYYRVQDGGSGDTIAFFCHFGMGIAMLAHLLGMSPSVAWQGFYLAPTSVTTVVTEERMPGVAAWRCTGVGDLSHLYDAAEPMSRSGLFRERYTDPD